MSKFFAVLLITFKRFT